MSVLDRWRDFRRAQRDALRASNHPHEQDGAAASAMAVLVDVLVPRHDTEGPSPVDAARPDGVDGDDPHAVDTDPAEPDDAAEPRRDAADDDRRRYGRAGRPLNRQSP